MSQGKLFYMDEIQYVICPTEEPVHLAHQKGLFPLCWRGEIKKESCVVAWDEEDITCRDCIELRHA